MNVSRQFSLRDILNYLGIGLGYICLGAAAYWHFTGENIFDFPASIWLKSTAIGAGAYYIGLLIPGSLPLITRFVASDAKPHVKTFRYLLGIKEKTDVRVECFGNNDPITQIVDEKVNKLFGIRRQEISKQQKVRIYYIVHRYVAQNSSDQAFTRIERLDIVTNFYSRALTLFFAVLVALVLFFLWSFLSEGGHIRLSGIIGSFFVFIMLQRMTLRRFQFYLDEWHKKVWEMFVAITANKLEVEKD